MSEGLFLWFCADLLGGWGVAERPIAVVRAGVTIACFAAIAVSRSDALTMPIEPNNSRSRNA